VDAERVRNDVGLPLEDGSALRPGDVGDEVDRAHELLLFCCRLLAGSGQQATRARSRSSALRRFRCQDGFVDTVALGTLADEAFCYVTTVALDLHD
jgi:hypothetical protein